MSISTKVGLVLRFQFIPVVIFALSACATQVPLSSSSGESSNSQELLDDAGQDLRADIGAADISNTEVLASLSDDGLGIELTQTANASQLTIRTNSTPIDYEVSRLNAPSRLVLDLNDTNGKIDRIFDITGNDLVSRVRVGSHPDKSRIVLDLNEASTYMARAEGGDILVTMSFNEEELRASPSQELLEGAANEQAPESDLSNEPIAAASELIDANPKLKSISIDAVPGEGNALIAKMESAGVYVLEKTAPSEYILRLEDATFLPQEVGTVLAPPQSGAIRSARPVLDGPDTLIRIFASPNSALIAKARGNQIIVQPEMYLAPADSADIRAQAELAEPEGAEAADEELDVDIDADLAELEGEVSALLDEAPKYTGRQISLDLQDTDIDNALRIIAEVSNLNIIASDDVTGKVTLRLIDVPWDQALDVILKTNGLDKVLEGNVMRIAPIEKLRQEREALKQAQEAEEELEPLVVKYVRISYARASELRTLVETVLTERGTVAYDERTNQLIVKDIRRGVKNVAELVARLDLRTPQVLLETQIIEAQRSFLRQLGSELGFSFQRGPETGNATGYNFPNSVDVGGSVDPSAPDVGSSFPSAGDLSGGSAVSFLLDSADGATSLDFRLSALETEGRVRIVSRPAVATTNNQQAVIKAVEKIRVKTPSGGLSVATGSGASASGSGGVATETIEVGIVLEVTPQASPDYYVLLDINAKSSTLGSTVVDGIPSEVERSATSTVLVSSGQTFAMGGIYKITDQDTLDGVPFLKDVPFLGHLFRRSGVDNADEELIFFITPRIVEGSFDDAAMKLSS